MYIVMIHTYIYIISSLNLTVKRIEAKQQFIFQVNDQNNIKKKFTVYNFYIFSLDDSLLESPLIEVDILLEDDLAAAKDCVDDCCADDDSAAYRCCVDDDSAA